MSLFFSVSVLLIFICVIISIFLLFLFYYFGSSYFIYCLFLLTSSLSPSTKHLDGDRMTRTTLTNVVTAPQETIADNDEHGSINSVSTTSVSSRHQQQQQQINSTETNEPCRDIRSVTKQQATTPAFKDNQDQQQFTTPLIRSNSNEMARFNSQPSLNGTLRLVPGPLGNLWNRTKSRTTLAPSNKVSNIANFFVQYRGKIIKTIVDLSKWTSSLMITE